MSWFNFIEQVFNSELWLRALDDPSSRVTLLAGIAQGVLTGGIAIVAGAFTLYKLSKEKKIKNKEEFLKWLSELNALYQEKSSYGSVRIELAKNRTHIRRIISKEMMMDDLFKDKRVSEDFIVEEDKAFLEGDETLFKSDDEMWSFLKDFTDYLYFFEQVLAFGEALDEAGDSKNATHLVNHFGWFLRSMLLCWSDHEDAEVRLRASCLFASYLMHNRYRRLFEVAICCIEDSFSKESALSEAQVNTLLTGMFKHYRHEAKNDNLALEQILKKWRTIIGSVGIVTH